MYREKKLTKNKWYLLQLSWWSIYVDKLYEQEIILFGRQNWFYIGYSLLGSIFSLRFGWSKKRDHAGFTFDLTLFGLNFIFDIYDCRHWDYEKNKWCEYD